MNSYALTATIFSNAADRRIRVTPTVQATSLQAALTTLTQRLRDQQAAGQVAWFTYPVAA